MGDSGVFHGKYMCREEKHGGALPIRMRHARFALLIFLHKREKLFRAAAGIPPLARELVDALDEFAARFKAGRRLA